jgi:alpha-tubulin suppressor-like RCC1 family protein
MGAHGRLGLGHPQTQILPAPVTALRSATRSPIASVSAGEGYAVALSRDGSAYIWGVIHTRKQHSAAAASTPKAAAKAAAKAEKEREKEREREREQQHLNLNIGSGSSAAEASGGNSSGGSGAVHIDNGSVVYGLTPRVLLDGSSEGLGSGQRIVRVSCATNRCCLLTASGALFVAGKSMTDQSIYTTPKLYAPLALKSVALVGAVLCCVVWCCAACVCSSLLLLCVVSRPQSPPLRVCVCVDRWT